MKTSLLLSTLALAAGICSTSFGQVTGTVKLDGKAPKRAPISMNPDCAKLHKNPVLDEGVVVDENNNLQNVVVYIKGDNVKGPAPKDPVILDQKGCQYIPHVVAVMVGQELRARNSDGFLHNVHSLPENSDPSNMAQVGKTGPQGDALKPIKASEVFKVKCDVHPWMGAWVYALDNPYFAVTNAKGEYSIDVSSLTDGDYELHAWQEKYKEQPAQKITIKDHKATADFIVKAPAPK